MPPKTAIEVRSNVARRPYAAGMEDFVRENGRWVDRLNILRIPGRELLSVILKVFVRKKADTRCFVYAFNPIRVLNGIQV